VPNFRREEGADGARAQSADQGSRSSSRDNAHFMRMDSKEQKRMFKE